MKTFKELFIILINKEVYKSNCNIWQKVESNIKLHIIMEGQGDINHLTGVIVELIYLNWADRKKCILAGNSICNFL